MNKTFQKSKFSDGGFVLHKITGDIFSGTCSAWYDKDGKLLDAEQFTNAMQTRPVKKDGPIWKRLEQLGPVWLRD